MKEIHEHPQFSYPQSVDYDYSLLRLKKTIVFDATKKPVPLPENEEMVQAETFCVVSGWGNTYNDSASPDMLHKVLVPIVSVAKCLEARPGGGPFKITPRMICAGYKEGGKDGLT